MSKTEIDILQISPYTRSWETRNMNLFLHGPSDRLSLQSKGKCSFSTSTPCIDVGEGKIHSLSVSISSSTGNDSGLGASISDISLTSDADSSLACRTFAVSVYKSPRKCTNYITQYTERQPDLPASPVSSKRHSLNHLQADFNSRRCLARKRLDCDFSEETDSLSTKFELRNCAFSTCARKLDLDVDIYESTDQWCSVTRAVPHLSTPDSSVITTQFHEILHIFSPLVSDRLIGRKMGEERVDIVSELADRNIDSVLLSIMSLLNAQDLCRMCVVSRRWKYTCESNNTANSRRRKFLRRKQETRRKIGKENAGKRRTAQTRSGSLPFQDLPIRQLVVDVPAKTVQNSITEHFIAVASCLKNDEKLEKCPRCRKPAKVFPVPERGYCQNRECNHDYCIKCLNQFHGSKPCTPLASQHTRTSAIGTKRSKQNLKRL